MAESITVTPAYGRDYNSQEAARKDWFAGKDFILETIDGRPFGRYCSCRDFPITIEVNIRYSKMRRKVIITAKDWHDAYDKTGPEVAGK